MIFPLKINNETILDLVFKITLYFQDAHTIEIRRGIAACARDYVELVGDRLTHQGTQRSRGWRRFKPDIVDWLAGYVEKIGPDDDIYCEFVEQPGDTEAAPRSSFYARGCRAWEQQLGTYQSSMRFQFPLDWFVPTDRPHPHDLMRRWSGLVRARHGWGGIGFSIPCSQQGGRRSEMLQYGLATLWPTLLLEQTGSNANSLIHGMREPGWLTAVGDEFLDKLGGKAALQARLAGVPGVSFIDYAGGVIIEAGTEPDPHELPLFDPAIAWMVSPSASAAAPMPAPMRDDTCVPAPPMSGPADYPELVAVAAALKPVRIEKYGRADGSLHAGGSLFWRFDPGAYLDGVRTKAWIDRFDLPSPWESYRIKDGSIRQPGKILASWSRG